MLATLVRKATGRAEPEETSVETLGRLQAEATVNVLNQFLKQRLEMQLIMSIWYARGGEDSVLREHHLAALQEVGLADGNRTVPHLYSAIWAFKNGQLGAHMALKL